MEAAINTEVKKVLKSMSDVFFYILIPVYNVEKYLNRCLDSCLNQTYKNFHIIAVDDGSSDSSRSILDEYDTKYECVTVQHKENGGIVRCRRTAMKIAYELMKKHNQSPEEIYFVHVDGDDFLELNALEVLNENIKKYNPDILMYQFKKVYGNVTKYPSSNGGNIIFLESNKSVSSLFFIENKSHAVWDKTHKASLVDFKLLDEVPYRINFYEDYLNLTFLLKNANNLLYIPNRLYNYFYNSNSVMRRGRTAEKYDIEARLYPMIYIYQTVVSNNTFCFDSNEINKHINIHKDFVMANIWNILNLHCPRKEKKRIFYEFIDNSYVKEISNYKNGYYPVTLKTLSYRNRSLTYFALFCKELKRKLNIIFGK